MSALALAACGGGSDGSSSAAADAASTSADPVSFSSSTVSVAQSTGTATVSVKRTGSATQEASVSYATTNGTAHAGVDYTATNGTLHWDANDTTAKTVSVPVSTANSFQGSKYFTVALSNPSSATAIATPQSSVVTITGATPAATTSTTPTSSLAVSGTSTTTTGTAASVGTLALSASTYFVTQTAGNVTVTVNRIGGSQGAVSVAYATTAGTAVAGTNFTASSGTLQWLTGDATAKTFLIPVSSIPFSGTKTLTVTLSQPTSAQLGTPSSATVSIVGTAVAATSTSTSPTGVFGIKVSGGKFVSTKDGSAVQIIGANVSGLETGFNWRFAPFQNAGVAFWKTVLNWNGSGINTVRLPLNEASWLNYTCYDMGTGASAGHYTATSGGAYTPDPSSVYQATVKQAVADATAAGLYVILDLHWGAPNNSSGQPLCPIGQPDYADADHAVTFWKQVADTFKDNPAVIFELFNEPFGSNVYTAGVIQNSGTSFSPGPDATKLANGGSYSPFLEQDNANNGVIVTNNMTWNVAGMISLLNTVRGEGATNVVLASPIGWANEIETWLGAYTANGNPDPLQQFGVAWHIYGWAKGTAPPLAVLKAGYPIIITETYGFDGALDGGEDSSGYSWAKQNGIGFLCWGPINDWGGQALSVSSTSPWGSCPAL